MKIIRKFNAFVLAVLVPVVVLIAAPAAATGLEKPTGRVILSVTGSGAATNVDGRADFDLAMLKKLGGKTLETTTFWTKGPQMFEGVWMKDLIAAVGASGFSTIHAKALNDYVGVIPAGDLQETDILVAYLHNGKTMAVREHGPLWIIVPAGADIEKLADKMVWQLRSIDFQ